MRTMYTSFHHFIKNWFHEDMMEEHKKILEPFQQHLQTWKQNLQNYKKQSLQPTTTAKELLSILNTGPTNLSPLHTQLFQQFQQEKDRYSKLYVDLVKEISTGPFFTSETIQKWNQLQQSIYHYYFRQFQIFLKTQDLILTYLQKLKQWERWVDQCPISLSSVEMEQYRMQFLMDHWTKQFPIQEIQSILHTYFTLYEHLLPIFQMFFTLPLHTCSLCCTDPKNTVLIPCGHTFCKTCSEKCIECPVCRSSIQNVQMMYL